MRFGKNVKTLFTPVIPSIAGFTIGIGLTYPICGFIIAHYGWRVVFYTTGSLGCIWCIAWWYFAFDTPAEHPRISKQELTYIQKCTAPTMAATKTSAPPSKFSPYSPTIRKRNWKRSRRRKRRPHSNIRYYLIRTCQNVGILHYNTYLFFVRKPCISSISNEKLLPLDQTQTSSDIGTCNKKMENPLKLHLLQGSRNNRNSGDKKENLLTRARRDRPGGKTEAANRRFALAG
ncbi:unnamed protein product [Nesidiocoris tenuis]|uniref:Major facilitator superfamily (MFS) profile domain-containing protein n=1 Tax=Nesidiocoris tenuis TaxID=355587 RepID=A0A6H5GIW4_9HEMI|nr:unnamed protein product [Nesidiocoris tenuis]